MFACTEIKGIIWEEMYIASRVRLGGAILEFLLAGLSLFL